MCVSFVATHTAQAVRRARQLTTRQVGKNKICISGARMRTLSPMLLLAGAPGSFAHARDDLRHRAARLDSARIVGSSAGLEVPLLRSNG